MRSTYRILLAVAVAALAFSAVAASAASAHEFIVAGSHLTETKEATGTGGSVEMAWKVLGNNVRVECKSTALTGYLETGGKSRGEIKVESCKMPEYPNCSVPSLSYKVKDSLAGVNGALTDEFHPAAGSEGLFRLTIKTLPRTIAR